MCIVNEIKNKREGVMFTRWGPNQGWVQYANYYFSMYRGKRVIRERNLNGDRGTVGLRQLSHIQPLTNQ